MTNRQAIDRAKTPHTERFYVGDEVLLPRGWRYDLYSNPAGCIRKVVSIEIDRYGNRRTWIQLKLLLGKKSRTQGWVAPCHDEFVLHKRAKKNVPKLVRDCSIMN